MTEFHVGTAGWSYLRWDKEFYPKGTAANEKLAHYATRFNAVELNNSFYQTPPPEQFQRWEKEVPKEFQFSVKASRYITHVKKLKDAEETLPRFLDSLSLQKKGGPLLFQLPPNFALNLERLEAFLKRLPKKRRHAIELRDPSWQDEVVYALLAKYKVAFCLFDTVDQASPRRLTTDFAYVRLRGREDAALAGFLKEWRTWLSVETEEAYVFFDNREEKRLAFGNALLFRELAG